MLFTEKLLTKKSKRKNKKKATILLGKLIDEISPLEIVLKIFNDIISISVHPNSLMFMTLAKVGTVMTVIVKMTTMIFIWAKEVEALFISYLRNNLTERPNVFYAPKC